MMDVEMLFATPIEIALEAGLICTNSEDQIEKYDAREFISKLVSQGHESVIEHINYTFRVTGVSRALLQELARHRHISLSVQSTRWALKKFAGKNERVEPILQNAELTYAQLAVIDELNDVSDSLEYWIEKAVSLNIPNDITKYFIQESLPTKLILTLNARELRHILTLRTSKRALKEFQLLCGRIYNSLPIKHQFLYDDIFDKLDQ